MSEIFHFVITVKEQWRGIMTGSLLIAVITAVQWVGQIRIPQFVYWMIICLTLFWAFYRAWRKEFRARKKAAERLLSEDEKHLLQRIRQLLDDYLELMRRFPDSPAVLAPFELTWRPLVGTTDVKYDVQQVIAWHKECVAFLDQLERLIGQSTTEKTILVNGALRRRPIMQFDCLAGLREIENLLLRKVTGSS